ncbi:EF-hand domain-containing protein [Geminicoccus roseus]|uniref:hypothetical protein n=1 Tax=Geminicoccus roseus TaxID=404900 RepID=UPI0004287C35|nr:hypothetical protein [Geminicoccus roseus]
MMKALLASIVLLLPVLSAPVAAAPPTPAAFDRFLRETGPACSLVASRDCFERIFRFVDRNRDGALDRLEMQDLHDHARAWMLENSAQLPAVDRQAAVLTMLAIDFVGLDQLFVSYDADGDGLLTRAEISADITLDERPVPVLVKDPGAVNWDQLLGRLGAGAAVLKNVLPRGRTS